MPDIKRNLEIWQEEYDWGDRGDNWSSAWGGPESQWFCTLMPRLRAFLPAPTVLEIAPGYGRWTQFLRPLASHLIAVDMTPRCIEGCRQRFGNDPHMEFHVNDGMSLGMVGDGLVDLVFSFDSLVHAPDEALASYLRHCARILAPSGVAFLHHSNTGRYWPLAAVSRKLPGGVSRRLSSLGLAVDPWASRSETMTSQRFQALAAQAGLCVVSQEEVAWSSGGLLVDCISVVTRPGSRFARPMVRRQNHTFTREAALAQGTAPLYDRSTFPGAGKPPGA